jgi:hypothetical protein
MNKKYIFPAMVFIMLLFSGCVEKKIMVKEYPYPDGFAVYSRYNRAISPDGVVYRIRKQINKPYAKLSFWKEALKKRMVDTGYIFVKENDILSGKKKGYLIELTAPYGEEDYTYLISIFLKEKEILIVEASGEVLLFKKQRGNILAAIKKIY